MASWRPSHRGLSDGKRNENRGAPGGRTRYPMTMRKIRLDAAMATRAGIKRGANIVACYSDWRRQFHNPKYSCDFRASQIDWGPSGVFGFQSRNGFGRALFSRWIAAESRSHQKKQPRSFQTSFGLRPPQVRRV